MMLNKYQKGFHFFLMLLLIIPALPKAESASGTLGKTLFATISEPKPSQTITMDVWNDEVFTIKGIAQRGADVNLYIYSRVPKLIQNFGASVSGSAVQFSWVPRTLFNYNPQTDSATTANGSNFRYITYRGRIPDSTIRAASNPTEVIPGDPFPPPIRDNTINGTINITCDKTTGTGVASLDIRLTAGTTAPSLLRDTMITETRNADALCSQIDSGTGRFKTNFDITDFVFPIVGGSIKGNIRVRSNGIEWSDSRFVFPMTDDPLGDAQLKSPENCILTMYTSSADHTNNTSRSFLSGNTTSGASVQLGGRIVTSDPSCTDINGTWLLGSFAIMWSIDQSNVPLSGGPAISCKNLEAEMPGFNCRGISGTKYNNPYRFYDQLLGYRDPIPNPGSVEPSSDLTKVNTLFMGPCNQGVCVRPATTIVNNNGNLTNQNSSPGNVECDYSGGGWQDGFYYVDLEQCDGPADRGACSGEGTHGPACETVGSGTPYTEWFTTFTNTADHSEFDTPGNVGLPFPQQPQNDSQDKINDFPASYNPMTAGSRNFHQAGYNLFVYATQTMELGNCGGGPGCGFDIVSDGAANTYTNYPIRDYVTLSDGFLQYEIYGLPVDEVADNEGVTRENGKLLAVVKDPSASTVNAPLPPEWNGKSLRFALYEVREGETGIGQNRPVTPRIPARISDPYISQTVAGGSGVLGHLLTATDELLYTPGITITAPVPVTPDKFEWEVYAESGDYANVGIDPQFMKADNDEHFEVIGTTPFDTDASGNKGLDKYVLNRYSDTHVIVATYRSTDTQLQGDNTATLFMTAAREAMSFLSVKQTGALQTISTQTFNLYGVAYDTYTKNLLPGVQLKLENADNRTRVFEQYTTTGYEGGFTFKPPQGTFRVTPITVNNMDAANFIFPANNTITCGGTDTPYQNLYCGDPFEMREDMSMHFDIPLSPSVAGTFQPGSQGNLMTDTFVVYVRSSTGEGASTTVFPDGKFRFFLPNGNYSIASVDKVDDRGNVLQTFTPGGQVTVNNTTSASLSVNL